MIEEIKYDNVLLAIIIRDSYSKEGVSFVTPNDALQQLAFMKHPKGKIIKPHFHNPVKREILFTKEVLFIKSGKLRVDFYIENNNYLKSSIISKGDVILLLSGGHGFTVLENIKMIEVKQGPYVGEIDKTHFDKIDESNIEIK